VFDSHIPCRTPTTQLKATAYTGGERTGKAWHVGIDIGRLLKVYGRPTEVRLLPDTTRSFTKFINQKASLLWGVFNCSKDDGKSRLYRIWTEIQVKASLTKVFMLHLHYVLFFWLFFGQKLFKCFKFRNTHSNILEIFSCYLFRFPRECEILLPLLVLKKPY